MSAPVEILLRSMRPSGRIRVILPASKSISNRLLIMRAVSGGAVEAENLSTADDTRYLREALESGKREIWLGHAGTALRFCLAWAAVTPGERLLRGSVRLSERPVAPLVDALRSLGADISFPEKEGYAPLLVRGKRLRGGTLRLDATVSSQFITALMLIGPVLDGGLELRLDGTVVSEPYLRMTARLMRRAGAEVVFRENLIQIADTGYAETSVEVEPDYSAASYFYAAAAFNRDLEIELPGLPEKSLQGDAAVTEIFHRFGIETRFTARGALLFPADIIDDRAAYDFLACPDLAQTVAVTAAGLRRPFHLTGLQTLRIKETDRIAALSAELAKCGVGCKASEADLRINHFSDLSATPRIRTYDDHRMAMAFAPLAAVFGEMIIEDPEVVSKSFPDFFREIKKVV